MKMGLLFFFFFFGRDEYKCTSNVCVAYIYFRGVYSRDMDAVKLAPEYHQAHDAALMSDLKFDSEPDNNSRF